MSKNKQIYNMLVQLRQFMVLSESFKECPELDTFKKDITKLKKQLKPFRTQGGDITKNYNYLKDLVNKLGQGDVTEKIILIGD